MPDASSSIQPGLKVTPVDERRYRSSEKRLQTQEMLDFCARKNILPECEMIAIQDIDTAFERLERGDVRYRFVIDMATLSAGQAA